MWPESADNKPLRTGLTTGSCATACTVAALRLLLDNATTSACDITLPRGQQVSLAITDCHLLAANKAYAATIKDAGDDPDVTHGATVFAEITLTTNQDIQFVAAEGVGTVTRQGLALAVGEPAINPVPRQMMIDHINALKDQYGYQDGVQIAIGVVNGEAIAQKTMNARLGIMGGLSILGTTGVVRPFSCAAYIASIHQGIDVAKANEITHLAACTGNLSEQLATTKLNLPDMAIIEMGDFASATFKYLKRHPVNKLSIVGGFGKISKLADGHTDLHSQKSAINFDFIAQCAADVGLPEPTQTAIRAANTSLEALSLCTGHLLADQICKKAWQQAMQHIQADISVDVWAIDRQGRAIGHYGPD